MNNAKHNTVTKKTSSQLADHTRELFQIAGFKKIEKPKQLSGGYPLLKEFLIQVDQNRELLEQVQTVFCHGDFWINNIRLQSDGTPATFDFENSLYADPLIDLYHAFSPAEQEKQTATGL